MSTKTYFKRISLAVILALSFGAFSSAPSQALVSGTGAVTLSASTDSRVAQETSTVTITASFTADAASESITIRVVGTGANTTSGATFLKPSVVDSANIVTGASTDTAVASTGLTYAASVANAFTRVKATFSVINVNVVGTHIYTVNVLSNSTIVATTTYTITVAAANTDATAAQSQLFLNEVLPTVSTYYMSDSSSLVKSAGQTSDLSLMTPAAVAYLGVNFRNSAGESVVSTTSTNVDGTMIVKITSGPGLLSKADAVKVRQVSVTRGETITIWNDGSSGVTTIVGYIGTTPLTQAAKTMTFYGKATSFVATANAVTAKGWNLSAGSDSVTSGTAILTFVATDAASQKVPEASQNRNGAFYIVSSDTKVVRSTSSATNGYGTCTAPSSVADKAAGKWTCDMYVIDSGTVTLTVTDSFTVASSTYTSNAISVTIAGTAVAGTIGFAKIGLTCTPGLTATGTFEPGESVIMCATAKDGLGRLAGQPTLAGKAHDPFVWNIPGDNLAQDKPFWIGASSGTAGALSTGATTLTTVASYLGGSSTFMNGEETVVVYMPTTSGVINIKGATGDTSAAVTTNYKAVTATLTVTGGAAQAAADAATAAAKAAEAAAVAAAEKAALDAVAAAKAAEAAAVAAAQKAALDAVAAANAATAAANAATAAAKAAQDAAVAEAQAATDAAAEAIDAANAATDAGNLAAEAADAATVAAEEARDAADAATAAVEELATQVATLMAALKAQITTLANTVAKIAKKVKA